MQNAMVKNEVRNFSEEYSKKNVAKEFETLDIPGSDDKVYKELLKHKPESKEEERFIDELKNACSKSIKGFKVFVNDPSIDDNGQLQFIAGFKPAVGYSYKTWEQMAKENGIRLGTKNEYVLFLCWLIVQLMKEGWSEEHAWSSVCTDSRELGHYCNSESAIDRHEPTGSRKIAGKCDLSNAFKVLAKDDENCGFWLAGGSYFNYSYYYPLATLIFENLYGYLDSYGIGWFVI